jgi:hypothetical protein
MHHKRRSRRQDKRNMLACGCCEDIRGGKIPVEDGPCTGRVTPKKPTPKKEKCPVNGTHEWYRETTVRVVDKFTNLNGYWNCEECRRIRKDGHWWCSRGCDKHTYDYKVEVTTRTATCIHCFKEQKPKATERILDSKIGRWKTYKPKAFKKRPVKEIYE